MSKEKRLHAFRKKVALDEVESKIAHKLGTADDDDDFGGYLSHYDASLINKGVVQTPKEESNNKKM
ncbi:hypothetical protein R9X47_27940 [Wukongibacter baidiensis]|uniref:hypothetical protein n=1 Tax=Wukongibacter baidiensis TaxID=1723361 RepID=UPI003D7FBD04